MSNFSDWKKLQQQRLEDRPIGEKIMGAGLGAGEALLSSATSLPASAIAGLEGLGRSASGQPLSDVVKAVESRQDQLTYAPRSPEGRQYLETLDKYIGQPYEDIKRGMGSTAIERGLGPEVATATHMMPDVALTLSTLGLGNLLTRGGRLKYRDIGGEWMPTPLLEDALRERGLTFDALSSKTIASIPEVLDKGLIPSSRTDVVAKEALSSQADIGGRQDALAPYKVGQGLKKDPVSGEALKQGFEPGLVQMIKTADSPTRFNMLRMAKNMETYKGNFSNANEYRPLNIVGDSIGSRLIDLRKIANDRRVKLEKLVNKELKGKRINPAPVYKNIIESLQKYNIGMARDKDTGELQFDFSDSDVKLDPQSQRLINQALIALPEGVAVDAAKAHQIKKQLDGLINYEKINVGDVTPQGKQFLMSIRSGLNDSIRNASEEYASLNDDLTVILDSFSDMQDLVGKKIDIFDPETNARSLGILSRKLVTNYAAQPRLESAINKLQQASDMFGVERGDNLTDLVTFANSLEKKFGTTVSGSFQGKQEAANQKIVDEIRTPSDITLTGAAIGAYNYARDKMRNINDEEAFKALYKLIREGGK